MEPEAIMVNKLIHTQLTCIFSNLYISHKKRGIMGAEESGRGPTGQRRGQGQGIGEVNTVKDSYIYRRKS